MKGRWRLCLEQISEQHVVSHISGPLLCLNKETVSKSAPSETNFCLAQWERRGVTFLKSRAQWVGTDKWGILKQLGFLKWRLKQLKKLLFSKEPQEYTVTNNKPLNSDAKWVTLLYCISLMIRYLHSLQTSGNKDAAAVGIWETEIVLWVLSVASYNTTSCWP